MRPTIQDAEEARHAGTHLTTTLFGFSAVLWPMKTMNFFPICGASTWHRSSGLSSLETWRKWQRAQCSQTPSMLLRFNGGVLIRRWMRNIISGTLATITLVSCSSDSWLWLGCTGVNLWVTFGCSIVPLDGNTSVAQRTLARASAAEIHTRPSPAIFHRKFNLPVQLTARWRTLAATSWHSGPRTRAVAVLVCGYTTLRPSSGLTSMDSIRLPSRMCCTCLTNQPPLVMLNTLVRMLTAASGSSLMTAMECSWWTCSAWTWSILALNSPLAHWIPRSPLQRARALKATKVMVSRVLWFHLSLLQPHQQVSPHRPTFRLAQKLHQLHASLLHCRVYLLYLFGRCSESDINCSRRQRILFFLSILRALVFPLFCVHLQNLQEIW